MNLVEVLVELFLAEVPVALTALHNLKKKCIGKKKKICMGPIEKIDLLQR